MIFADNKVQVSGWNSLTQSGSLILNINKPSLNSKVAAYLIDDSFLLKDEFHITCIGNSLAESLSTEQLALVEGMIAGVFVDDIYLDDKLYFIDSPKVVDGQLFERQAIIVSVISESLTNLLQEISDKLGIVIQPYLHITIATRPDNQCAKRGIGIESYEKFELINQGEYIII